MRKWLLIGCLGLIPATGHAEEADFTWLSGCWERADGQEREVWSAPEGGVLFGYSVTLKGGKAGFFEHLRIETGPNGRYVAYPGGKSPTAFALSASGPNEAVFINEAHDYPQKIAYQRDGAQLTATISLADGSKPRAFEKTRCTE